MGVTRKLQKPQRIQHSMLHRHTTKGQLANNVKPQLGPWLQPRPVIGGVQVGGSISARYPKLPYSAAATSSIPNLQWPFTQSN